MKRPIDPNLQNPDSSEFFEDVESCPISFEEEQTTPDISDIDRQGRDISLIDLESEQEMTIEENDIHTHHHHHHSSSHHHSCSSRHYHSTSHSHSHSHHHSSKNDKKKLSLPLRIVISIASAVAVIIIFAMGSLLYLEHQGKDSMTNVTTQTNYDEKITYNGHHYVYNNNVVSIAFIGVDKRELGTDNGKIGTAGQADANIVLAVDTATGRAKAIAVPRDTMVEVALYSSDNDFLRDEEMQLCLSYAYGNGTDTSANNVTTSLSRILYNVPVNKYFALDLNGIAPINDAIGGVTVSSLYDFDKLNIKQGDTLHLTGNLTETYVRQRDMDTVDASLNRTARQVQYIKAFAAQLAPSVINDFTIVSRLYNTAIQYSSTNISLSDATYMASLLVSKNITDFESVTIPGEMKASTKIDYADFVYAEFYPNQDALMEIVLDTFYTQID